MFEYIFGKIVSIESNYVVLENNNIGYLIYVSNPYSYKENNDYKVYIYQHIREDENTLYGFKSKNEKELFLRLIDVKGLGCKMALPMLSVDINNIESAIEQENIDYLKKFPKIGDKVAKQIILDLKGKLSIESTPNNLKELEETLKALGYKNSDINKVLPKITETEIEKQLKEALKLLLK